MKAAIFGGSFDPLHIGHTQIIESALKCLDIDQIFVVPTYLSPFKDASGASANLRISWLEKVYDTQRRVHIIDYEVRQKRAVPSIETVLYLKKKYDLKKIYLIIGADNYKQITRWHRYTELAALVEFVVATREALTVPDNLKKLDIHATISSSKLRANMNSSFIPKPIATEVTEYYTRNKMNERIEQIVKILDDKKAENIQVIDMSEKDYFVERVIIATALGERHGFSLLDDLKKGLTNPKESFLHIDDENAWVVIDLGDILIHIMSEEYRAKYNLEDFLAQREREMYRED